MSSDIPPLPRGDLLTPMDLGWEEARRVANGRMQGRPALVARCLGVADVCAALRLAQDRRLIISVRGGGHSVAGWSTNDGGLVIDLTRMRGVHVDPNEATAWIGGGALAIDVISEASLFGLAPVTGVSTSVGVVGLVTGLGEGYLTPRYGFGTDSVLTLEVVTADGSVLTVSADEHQDLFWAMRGAGPNFGVVTAVKLRLHPIPSRTTGGLLTFTGESAVRATPQVWEVMRNGSAHIFPFAVYDLDSAGALQMRFFPGHTGDANLAELEIGSVTASARPSADETRPMSYIDLVNEIANPARPDSTFSRRQVWDIYRFNFDDAEDAQMALVLELARLVTPHSHLTLWRTPRTDEPNVPSVSPRSPGINVFIPSYWDDPLEDTSELDWLDRTASALRESGLVSESANAMNHVSRLDSVRVRRLYGEDAYARLAAIKSRVDPTNVFHRNYNIPPSPVQGDVAAHA